MWGKFKTTSWMNWDCLILAAAGKVLPFPLGPHSPPICLARVQALTASPPDQVSTGSRAMTGAPCCQKRTVLHRHFLAHHFLFLPIWSCSFSTFSSAIPQVHPGTIPSLQNGISLQCYGTGNMLVWLQRSFYLLILCQWALEGCSAIYTRYNRTAKKGWQGASLQVMPATRFWLASVKPSIPVPYVIVQNQML